MAAPIEVSHALVDAIMNCGETPRSYAGRMMYGDQCVGVDTDSPLSLLVNLTMEMDEDDAHWLTCASMDSMGTSSILYFPRIEWDSEYFDEGDDDDDPDGNYLGEGRYDWPQAWR